MQGFVKGEELSSYCYLISSFSLTVKELKGAEANMEANVYKNGLVSEKITRMA